MMAHCAAIAQATDLPVSGDLENGFGDTPETVAETIRLAAAVGLVGCSIEDSTGLAEEPVYELEQAVERIKAAVAAVRALPFPFTLTARAENFLFERPDLKDTVRRLQAFQEVGANVLYAPGLSTREEIAAVIRSVERPVNVLAVAGLSLNDLSAMGAKRVSVGSALSRAAYGGLMRAAQEMRERGTFTFAEQAISFHELTKLFSS